MAGKKTMNRKAQLIAHEGAARRAEDAHQRASALAQRTAAKIATRNEAWGFWGTISRNKDLNPARTLKEWDAAVATVCAELKVSLEDARDLLDARFGRHLADQLDGETAAGIRTILGRPGWRRDAMTTIRENAALGGR